MEEAASCEGDDDAGVGGRASAREAGGCGRGNTLSIITYSSIDPGANQPSSRQTRSQPAGVCRMRRGM